MNEEVQIMADVYNWTIAANMTKNCSPIELNFCIRQCVFVFGLQMCLVYYFGKDKYQF